MFGITEWLVSKTAEGTAESSERRSSKATGRDADHDTYNYRRFQFLPDRDGVHRGVKAGEEATDVTVYTLDGDPVSLSDLWADGPVVLEFGSITCPVFTEKVDAINDLAATYGDEIDFYVVYTREAHPGHQYHRHTSFEQKCQHARDAKHEESVHRDVLVDDVDGTMHRAYGSLPNSAYVIGRDGVVAHHADWLDVAVLADQLDELLDHDGRAGDVTPAALDGSFPTFDLDLIRTGIRVHRRAGAGSLRDLLVSLPGMATYRAKQRLRRVVDLRFGSTSGDQSREDSTDI